MSLHHTPLFLTNQLKSNPHLSSLLVHHQLRPPADVFRLTDGVKLPWVWQFFSIHPGCEMQIPLFPSAPLLLLACLQVLQWLPSSPAGMNTESHRDLWRELCVCGRISEFTLHNLMSQCQCCVCGRKAELSPDVHWGETNQHHRWPWPLPLNFDLERRLMGEGGGAVRWLGCAGPRSQNKKSLEIWVKETSIEVSVSLWLFIWHLHFTGEAIGRFTDF